MVRVGPYRGGIFIIADVSELDYDCNYVVQRYVVRAETQPGGVPARGEAAGGVPARGCLGRPG
jgi:hypothetical protein